MKRTILCLTALIMVLTLTAVPMHSFAESQTLHTDIFESESTSAASTTVKETKTEPTLTIPQPTYATETETTPHSETPPDLVQAPLIRITRQSLPASLKYGDAFTLVIVIQNYGGNTPIKTGRLTLEPSDGLTLDEDSTSLLVKPLSPGDVGRATVHLKVKKDAESPDQSLSVTYTYSYQNSKGNVEGEAKEKLLIPVKVRSTTETTTGKIASATPNIIVSSYDFGGRVSAGDSFTLSLEFRNTSRLITAENIVMSVETGDAISITNASNTYYFSKLSPLQSVRQTIPMTVSPNADAQGGRIDISFKYEYVDSDARSNASANERLAIPITIPDRFIISKPETVMLGVQYEELTLSLPYVNKSRVAVNNVTADLIYDENTITCEQSRLNLGNLESGKSGTIDFFFTPSETGKGEVTVKILYENELAEEKTVDILVPFSVDPAVEDLGMGEVDMQEEPGESGMPGWVLWACIGGGAAVLLIVILLIVRHKKKKKTIQAVEFNWDLPQSNEVNAHEDD